MSYTGQRFPFQDQVGGIRGGMMSEPYSGVVSGLIVTAGTVTQSACPLNISAGSARLDGQLCTLASAISGLVLLGTTNQFQSVGTYGPFGIYLRPRRLVETTTADITGTPAAGTLRIKVQNRSDAQLGEFEEFIHMKQYNGTAWVTVNPLEGAPSSGQNNSPYGDVNPVIDTATSNNASFFLSPEKAVYLPASVINNPNQGINPLRKSGSVLLALVTVTTAAGPSYSATVVPYTEFEKVPF